MYLRDMLMEHQILPHRDRCLVRSGNWLRGKLDAIESAEDEQLVRRFATGRSLRQLRQRAAREPRRPGLTKRHCHEISSAAALLACLGERGTASKACTQTDLDAWATAGNSSRQRSRAFVVWSTRNDTMPRQLHLPYQQSAGQETITQTRRLHLLRDLIDPANPSSNATARKKRPHETTDRHTHRNSPARSPRSAAACATRRQPVRTQGRTSQAERHSASTDCSPTCHGPALRHPI